MRPSSACYSYVTSKFPVHVTNLRFGAMCFWTPGMYSANVAICTVIYYSWRVCKLFWYQMQPWTWFLQVTPENATLPRWNEDSRDLMIACNICYYGYNDTWGYPDVMEKWHHSGIWYRLIQISNSLYFPDLCTCTEISIIESLRQLVPFNICYIWTRSLYDTTGQIFLDSL